MVVLSKFKYIFIKLILKCHAYLFQVQFKDIFLAPSKMCFILDLHSLKEENIHVNVSCQLSNNLFGQISPFCTKAQILLTTITSRPLRPTLRQKTMQHHPDKRAKHYILFCVIAALKGQDP